MNVHLYSLPDDVKSLCARFDLLVLLPVDDWFELFERSSTNLPEKAGQSPPAYIVALLKAHVQQKRSQNNETKNAVYIEK